MHPQIQTSDQKKKKQNRIFSTNQNAKPPISNPKPNASSQTNSNSIPQNSNSAWNVVTTEKIVSGKTSQPQTQSQPQPQTQTQPKPEKKVQWCWKKDNNEWEPYLPNVSKDIEAAYKKKLAVTPVDKDRYIDFEKRLQIRYDDPDRWREVRRQIETTSIKKKKI